MRPYFFAKSLIVVTAMAVFFSQLGSAYGQTNRTSSKPSSKPSGNVVKRFEHPYYTIKDLEKSNVRPFRLKYEESEYYEMIEDPKKLEEKILKEIRKSKLIAKFEFRVKNLTINKRKRSENEQGCRSIVIEKKRMMACLVTYTINKQDPLYVSIGRTMRSIGKSTQWLNAVLPWVAVVVDWFGKVRLARMSLKLFEWFFNSLGTVGALIWSIGDPMSLMDNLKKYGFVGTVLASGIKGLVRLIESAILFSVVHYFLEGIGRGFEDWGKSVEVVPGAVETRGFIIECSNCSS
jgi:hypothetical protein